MNTRGRYDITSNNPYASLLDNRDARVGHASAADALAALVAAGAPDSAVLHECDGGTTLVYADQAACDADADGSRAIATIERVTARDLAREVAARWPSLHDGSDGLRVIADAMLGRDPRTSAEDIAAAAREAIADALQERHEIHFEGTGTDRASRESVPVAVARSYVAAAEAAGRECSWAPDGEDPSQAWIYESEVAS